ncbi:MAG: ATP-binding protein [Phycisphaerae bacterium]|nr:ATP-binding protein [Phycisphaerae bacterium]
MKRTAAQLIAALAGGAIGAAVGGTGVAIPLVAATAVVVKVIDILATRKSRREKLQEDMTRLDAAKAFAGVQNLRGMFLEASARLPEYKSELDLLVEALQDRHRAKEDKLLQEAVTGLFERTGPTTDPQEFADRLGGKQINLSAGDGSSVFQIDTSGTIGPVAINIFPTPPTTGEGKGSGEDVGRGIRPAVAELAGEPDETTPTPRRRRRRRTLIWNVPYRRNPNFTGREGELKALHDALASGTPAALTQAIAGLGGVGKTQLALEYAYRHRDDYEVILWVRSEQPAQLAGDYAALAEALNLPEKDAAEQEQTIAAVRSWLEQNTGWLAIFDNVPEPSSLDGYLPRPQTGAVIITSRHGAWRGTAEPLEVKVLPPKESIAFLKHRTGREDDADAGALADMLGHLPLALEQAAAYVEENGVSFGQYLEIFKKHQKDILRRKVTTSDYGKSAATTWEVSFRKLRPEAADLLNLCAFLAPDDIPLDLIAKGAEFLPKRLAKAVSDKKSFAECVGQLTRYSLVTRGNDAISVHRIVQAVVRDRLSLAQRKSWAAAGVKICNRAYPFESEDVRTWGACRRLLPHALAAAGHAEAHQVALEEASRLLNHVGLYLRGRAEFAQAKEVIGRALKIHEKAYGKNHPNVATSVNNLGSVLSDLGDRAGAKKCFERALKIDEKAYGKHHPNVATSVNNLGSVLRALGDLPQAKKCFKRALKIDEDAFGPDHPKVAISVNNIGSVFYDLGDLEGAKKCVERALKIDEKAYGKDHPSVALRVNNLGDVLKNLGNSAGAKKCYERALGIFRKFLGEDHPHTQAVRDNLAVLKGSGRKAGKAARRKPRKS